MKALFIFIACFMPVLLQAQDIKLISATRQDWSGGIAGHRGSNYTFAIRFDHYTSELIPDTIWIGQDAVLLNEDDPPNVKRSRKGDTLRFDVRVGIAKDDYRDRHALAEQQKEVSPPLDYKGVALLSYIYKGQQKYFVISKITSTLEPIAYP